LPVVIGYTRRIEGEGGTTEMTSGGTGDEIETIDEHETNIGVAEVQAKGEEEKKGGQEVEAGVRIEDVMTGVEVAVRIVQIEKGRESMIVKKDVAGDLGVVNEKRNGNMNAFRTRDDGAEGEQKIVEMRIGICTTSGGM